MKPLKKIAVVLPVLLAGAFYRYAHQFSHVRNTRMILITLAVVLFFLWVTMGAIRRKQSSFFDIVIQSSFYVYVFSVHTLTGYFVFFNQVSAHGWWHTM